MIPRTLIAFLLAAAASSDGCIEANRPAAQDAKADSVGDADGATADAVADSVADTTARCGSPSDCEHLAAPPCAAADCVGHSCVVTFASDTTACGDAAGSCAGNVWMGGDRCDGAGRCRTPGDVVCAALPGSCQIPKCVAGIGCGAAPAASDTECATGAGSGTCDGLTWHRQDVCDAGGSCVEKGSEACTAGFCEAPVCSASGCSVREIGGADQIAGPWHFVLLRYQPPGPGLADAFGARGALTFGADGKWSRGAVEISGVGAFPATQGQFCAAPDGTIAMTVGLVDGAPNDLHGQVTEERDFMFLLSRQRPELMVAVREQNAAIPATNLAGRFHMVGVIKKKTATTELYTIDGVLSFGSDGCLDRAATYQRSDQTEVVTIPQEGACLSVSASGEASFPHTEKVGDGIAVPIEASGHALSNRDVLVMAIDTTTDVFPSLLIFVREAADSGPSALSGGYTFGGLETATTGYDRVGGEIVYDGAGKVTSYHAVRPGSEESGGGGPQDRYTVAVAGSGGVGDLAGGYTHDVGVGTTRDRRLGHVATRRTAARGDGTAVAPIVAHVPVTATWHLTPGIQIGVKQP